MIALEKCPFCLKQFPPSKLNSHFFSEHQGQHFYLRVNDSIIRDAYSVQWIENLEIVLSGYKLANVEISGSNFVNKLIALKRASAEDA